MAEITDFWFVTKPTKQSTLTDILFVRDIKGIQNQFLGGLKASEIIGIFTTEPEARRLAKKLLRKPN